MASLHEDCAEHTIVLRVLEELPDRPFVEDPIDCSHGQCILALALVSGPRSQVSLWKDWGARAMRDARGNLHGILDAVKSADIVQ